MRDGYTIDANEPSPELQPFDPREGNDFNTEQQRIHDWATADIGYVGEVIAMTPIAGVRAGIDMAHRVALEHENRAAAARRVEKRLREELASAAQHGYETDEDEDEKPLAHRLADEITGRGGLAGPLFGSA